MFRRVVVSGASMEPTLHEGQRLLVLETKHVKKNDIVVFVDAKRSIKAVKRVVDVTEGSIRVAGDSQTTTVYEPIKKELLLGKVLFSYRPLRSVS